MDVISQCWWLRCFMWGARVALQGDEDVGTGWHDCGFFLLRPTQKPEKRDALEVQGGWYRLS
jgi:hypothetical protein